MGESKKTFAIIGSYADAANSGLYACEFNANNGELTLLDQAAGLQNPTFAAVDAEHNKVYAITEAKDANDQRCGAAVAFDFDPLTGKLTLLNQEMTTPTTTCHIVLDHTRQCAMVSSYHGGMVSLSPLLPDGRIGTVADIQRHSGSSLLPVQDRARAHSVFIDRSNRFAGVCDLGLDRIFMYRLDLQANQLIPHGEVQVAPGSGPRHFTLHPSLPYGYVINELNSTMIAFSYDEELGQLNEIQTVSTLPEGYEGENATADIHISPDGRFLYGSNRGHDSIVVHAIDQQTGKLTYVEHASTLGGHPRNFGLSPDGRFLLAANRDGNNIVTFARDAQTGTLLPTGSELQVSKPVFIQFVERG